RAQDGRGEGSTLLARLLGALGLQTFDDLMRWTATATPAQVAALAPHVLNAARDGEVVAQRAVDDAARELVALVIVLERYYPGTGPVAVATGRSEEHTSELQSRGHLVCRLLLEKKKKFKVTRRDDIRYGGCNV